MWLQRPSPKWRYPCGFSARRVASLPLAVMGMRWKPPVLPQLKACSADGRQFKMHEWGSKDVGAVGTEHERYGCSRKQPSIFWNMKKGKREGQDMHDHWHRSLASCHL
eukprot:131047-Pelagomonas_calceolata.AAC.4